MNNNKHISLTLANSEYEFLRYQAIIHNSSPTSYIKKLIAQDIKEKHKNGSIK